MHRWLIWLAAIALAVMGIVSTADAGKLYKWTDANGQNHYSQTPPPDQAVDYDVSRIAGGPNAALQPYCSALNRFAFSVFGALRSGASMSTVIATSQSVESEELGKVNQGQLQEVANYVYALKDSKDGASGVAKLVEDGCMRGSFGSRALAKAGGEGEQGGGKSGTGWFVERGTVVTNLHVVKDSDSISVVLDSGETLDARLVSSDSAHDLALLSVSGAGHIVGLPVAAAEVRLGAKVFTIGFPHTGVMGVKPKLTDGVISASTGLQDDPDMYQISVPVQSGNSGGPLIDSSGNVVGIVTAKLSASAMYSATRDVTQNVNYAVKSGFALELAGTTATKPAADSGSMEDVAERVQRSVVRVLAQ